ncbi:uncharacterized protein EI90DRAFT_3128881 [Cantharellus anzutake]|uniref:uncharacterized protein n=1 Tax=Cantharellus anzutake TaxID=1750568 RepID=UPI001908DC20|nr:uncharacterized protein EI90DRAFT_3128881 [Cantharellus anzutake]KAF8325313.1 hypothetical protein EI90DRAFT_3128881 [Cantharellus anzutake]
MSLQRESTPIPDAPETTTASLLEGDYSIENFPPAILNLVIQDAQIHADVVNAGHVVGTQLQTEDQGLMKNHWYWRGKLSVGGVLGQVQLGFNFQSFASNQGQYGGSSRVGHSDSDHAPSVSGGGSVYSDFGSQGKPPLVEEGVEVAMAICGIESEETRVGSDKDDLSPETVALIDDWIINQPSEGAPALGIFEIRLRPRTDASYSTCHSFSFNLKAGTTVGDLIHSIRSRPMQPFLFRKINGAFFGCRDGMFQVASAWMDEGWMVDPPICLESPFQHLFYLLGWRYSKLTMDPNPNTSNGIDDNDGPAQSWTLQRAQGDSIRATFNPIDRAIWPNGFVHRPHPLLQYNTVRYVCTTTLPLRNITYIREEFLDFPPSELLFESESNAT